jgi:hypothetical protein
MRLKKSPQLPGAGRKKAWHHHWSDTPTSPRAIYVLRSAKGTNIFVGSVYERFYETFLDFITNFRFHETIFQFHLVIAFII